MKLKDTKLAPGGLMRCCLVTLAEHLRAHGEEDAIDGTILDCAHEKPGNANMILAGGLIWRWNRPKEDAKG